ncbi:glycoside hydrolase family 32 protein [Streptomyces physcomitrii]|uniref:glycoside hydrolase family 32 protein n=1 Tax=Streptomyces physcomitrii TaxID=2724184 RepID=UPI0033DDB6F4
MRRQRPFRHAPLRALLALAAGLALVLPLGGASPGAAAAPPEAAGSAAAAGPAAAEEPPGAEPYRPQFHFSPARNWMNDPNGLVHYDGEYHLFFQYNPEGNTWGNMSWGHAVSRDLVHWEELPLALPHDEREMVFSGSVVVDRENTSGFGSPENPAMVAVYTSHAKDGSRQAQSLAYSTDRGRTWTKYAGNPVLDIGARDFRDPKVQWHEPSRSWLMTVALPLEHKVRFYRSPDLKQWTELSDFGPAGAVDGVWECPDLFPMQVDGDPERTKWVLVVNLNPGGIAGGSGAQYFVGDFDGTRFTADPDQGTRWLDHGKDYYAAVSWDGDPEGRRHMIGWMNNWQYGEQIPTDPWRSAMSVPRTMGLGTVDGRPTLTQQPVAALDSLRLPDPVAVREVDVPEGSQPLAEGRGDGRTLDIEARFSPGGAERFGLELRAGDGQKTVVGYDAAAGEVYVDRTHSGDTGFSPDFPGTQRAPLAVRDGEVRLRILLDASSVEVFGGAGESVLTDQIFPGAPEGVRLFAEGGTARLKSLDLHRLGTYRP